MLERLFGLRRHGTSVPTEIRAGVVTFMTMCYIVFVQRAVLGGPPPAGAGMDPGAVVVVTCLVSALACFVMGFVANYPVALAPVMGENFFFVTVAGMTIGGETVGWRVALTATFISGALFLLLSVVRLRERIFSAIPDSLKFAIAVGIGLLIALVGLQKAGVIVGDPFTQVKLGPLRRPETLLSLGGLAVTAVLWARRVRGAFLIGIALTTAAGLALGLVTFRGIAAAPPSIAPIAFQLDFAGTLRAPLLPVVLVFLLMVLFDTIGTLIGVGEQAGLIRDGKLERAGRALLADAIGTTAGAGLGSSTVSSYIESAAGVAEGGRTGLTAITTGVLFLLTIFFTPLVEMVGGGALVTETLQVGPQVLQVPVLLLPVIAPVMILVGCLMAAGVRKIDWTRPSEALPAFLVIVGTPLTYNIANGFALGFIGYPLLKLATGRAREVSPLMYVLGAVFLLYFIFLRH
ncbi:MAG: NCS2 family permease [Acidobacteria bacterium]|nr:NCS2 family permease [Acidobacteriota bacterium]